MALATASTRSSELRGTAIWKVSGLGKGWNSQPCCLHNLVSQACAWPAVMFFETMGYARLIINRSAAAMVSKKTMVNMTLTHDG